jgi:hypothetical protein
MPTQCADAAIGNINRDMDLDTNYISINDRFSDVLLRVGEVSQDEEDRERRPEHTTETTC